MGRPLEEDIDYSALNKKAAAALLARLVKFHAEPVKTAEIIFLDFDPDDLAPRAMMVRRVQQVVCLHYRIRLGDMLSASRRPVFTLPRQIAYYLAKQLTILSLPAIGRKFGGRDHTTILHSVRKIREMGDSDPAFAKHLRDLEEIIETAP